MRGLVDSDAITRRQFHEILRRDFPSFIHQCFHCLAPSTPYRPNWHIDALGQAPAAHRQHAAALAQIDHLAAYADCLARRPTASSA